MMSLYLFREYHGPITTVTSEDGLLTLTEVELLGVGETFGGFVWSKDGIFLSKWNIFVVEGGGGGGNKDL